MKRSELVQSMTEYWFGMFLDEGPDHLGLDPSDFCEVKEKMDQLLQYVEYKGMEPPFCDEIYSRVWRDGGTGNKWEKE